ncbi:MAG: citrulline utilization hydrolase CtlX [Candidatus Rariloculaceae bacterium]
MRSTASAQTTSAVLMVRPESFGSNPQTIESNSCQLPSESDRDLLAAAQREFDTLVATLTDHGVRVVCFDRRTGGDLPDECFPNNWISLHEDGSIVLYPMMAENRRQERRPEIVAALNAAQGYEVSQQIDLSHHENSGCYLEGTGSVVLDRVNKIAYACSSPRTHEDVLTELATRRGYETVFFDAADRDGNTIYHTNVMLAIGQNFCVVCAQAVRDSNDRSRLMDRLNESGRDVIGIDLGQLHAFAGNMLELQGTESPLIVLSATAFGILTLEQKQRLAAHGRLVRVPLSTIETYGGGSARCLMA